MLNDRWSGGETQLSGGLGDVGTAARFEVVSIGEYAGLPALAFTLGAIAPTGRRPEQTSPPLFAGTTGRGAWAVSLALETEYASLPWFVRLDAGITASLPFRRSDTGASQQYGRVFQAALSAGNEILPEKLIVAVAVSGEREAPLHLDGAEIPSSRAYSYSLAGSLSWLVDPHWTLVTNITNNVWPDGAGMNRDARIGLTLGARYGYF